jgi:hypothetical protein
MKKLLSRWLIVFALIVLAIAVVFELETHAGRGWLRGEAFFDGRPTSYWRTQCHDWLARFDDKDSLTACTWLLGFEIPAEPGFRKFGVPDDLELKASTMGMPKETLWKTIMDRLRSKDELVREKNYDYAPRILWATPDTEPVLRELQQEEKYQWLATLALRRVEHYRKHEAEVINGIKKLESTP